MTQSLLRCSYVTCTDWFLQVSPLHNMAHRSTHRRSTVAVQGGHVADLLSPVCGSMGLYSLFSVRAARETVAGLLQVTQLRRETPVGGREKVRQYCFQPTLQ